MTESYRIALTGARYAPHAYGGSPVDNRIRTASVDSVARRRLEETHVDARQATFYDDWYYAHHSQHLSPPRSAAAIPPSSSRDLAHVPYDTSRRQLSQSPTTYQSQTRALRRPLAYMDVPTVQRSSSPFRSPSSAVRAGPTTSSPTPRIHSPTVFGDLYESPSVVTGMSEQELLPTVARDDNRRKRQRHKMNKKNKQQPIVSVPFDLPKGLALNKKDYYGHMGSAAEFESHMETMGTGTPMAMQESELSLYNPRIDDIDQATAESTCSPDPPRLPTTYSTQACRTNNYGAPFLYSTLPAQQAIVNEADGDSILLWQSPNDQDLQSIDSFPILSKHCGFSLSGLESSGPMQISTRTDKEKSVRNSTCPASEGTGYGTRSIGIGSSPPRRAVRFSRQSPRALISMDEWEVDAVQTTRDATTVWNRSVSAVVTPPRKSGIAPKSILRATRFSRVNPAPRTSAAYYAQIQAFREKYHRHKQQESDMIDRNIRASIDKSPPRNGSLFTYQNGDGELSPIPVYPELGSSQNNAYDDAAWPSFVTTRSHAKTSAETTNQIYAEYRNPSPIFSVGDDATQDVPDHDNVSKDSDYAPLPEWYESLEETDPNDNGDVIDEEEERSVSTTSFTQTVAAIVIQAAFRRYRVQWIYSDVLARRCLQRQRLDRHHDLYRDSVQMEVLPETKDQLVLNQSFNEFTARPDDSVRSNKENEKTAATIIQATFRGYWVRDCLSVDSYCATLIQKAWRGHQAHSAFLFSMYGIISIQSLYRRYRVRTHWDLISRSAMNIQKTVRGFIARKELRSVKRLENTRPMTVSNPKEKPAAKTLQQRAMFAKRWRQKREDIHRKEAQTKAAIVIQKHWRRFHQERKYTKILVDVLKIQTFIRRWVAYCHVANIQSVQGASSLSDASCHSTAADMNTHASDDSHGQDACPCTRSVIDLWQQRLMRTRDS